MLILQGVPRKVQETPFEIVSISQASVLLLVLGGKKYNVIIMSFSLYIITVAD